MKFEWDYLKDIENRKKHGISFEEAQAVFTSEFRLEYDSSLEERIRRIEAAVFNGKNHKS